MTDVDDKLVDELHEMLMNDPDFIPPIGTSKDDAAWAEAWRRFRQKTNNEKALSMGEDTVQKQQPPRPGLVPQSGDPRHPYRWIRPEDAQQAVQETPAKRPEVATAQVAASQAELPVSQGAQQFETLIQRQRVLSSEELQEAHRYAQAIAKINKETEVTTAHLAEATQYAHGGGLQASKEAMRKAGLEPRALKSQIDRIESIERHLAAGQAKMPVATASMPRQLQWIISKLRNEGIPNQPFWTFRGQLPIQQERSLESWLAHRATERDSGVELVSDGTFRVVTPQGTVSVHMPRRGSRKTFVWTEGPRGVAPQHPYRGVKPDEAEYNDLEKHYTPKPHKHGVKGALAAFTSAFKPESPSFEQQWRQKRAQELGYKWQMEKQVLDVQDGSEGKVPLKQGPPSKMPSNKPHFDEFEQKVDESNAKGQRPQTATERLKHWVDTQKMREGYTRNPLTNRQVKRKVGIRFPQQ